MRLISHPNTIINLLLISSLYFVSITHVAVVLGTSNNNIPLIPKTTNENVYFNRIQDAYPKVDFVHKFTTRTKQVVQSTISNAKETLTHNIFNKRNSNNVNNFNNENKPRFNKRIFHSIPAVITKNDEARYLCKTREVSALQTIRKTVIETLSKELSQSGVYFGLAPQTVKESYQPSKTPTKRLDLRESMGEALSELRIMRQEMEALRNEIQTLQQQISKSTSSPSISEDGDDDSVSSGVSVKGLKQIQKKRKKELEQMSRDVENWAKQMLRDQLPQYSKDVWNRQVDNDNNVVDWQEVKCTKMFEQKFNANQETKAYIAYLKDMRPPKDTATANPKYYDPTIEYPCIKMFSTIDAPIEDVCVYLANDKHVWDYNSLIQEHADVEVISPNSKICWGQTPQVLFVKPKDFVTYCSYKFLRDNTQIIINQAVEHPSRTANAYALRGATIIRPHPDEPTERTQIYMVAHASAGADIPVWAMKTAIKSLAPIEPFRFFYRMNQGIIEAKDEIRTEIQRLKNEMEQKQQLNHNDDVQVDDVVAVNNSFNNNNDEEESTNLMMNSSVQRSHRLKKKKQAWLPGGIAQLGYACFWPAGGVLIDDNEEDGVITKEEVSGVPTSVESTTPSDTYNNDFNSPTDDNFDEVGLTLTPSELLQPVGSHTNPARSDMSISVSDTTTTTSERKNVERDSVHQSTSKNNLTELQKQKKSSSTSTSSQVTKRVPSSLWHPNVLGDDNTILPLDRKVPSPILFL